MINRKVSIIMPMKNSEAFLEECLDSIQRQTYDNWELFVVNDHSSDSSVSIIKRLSKSDRRISLIHNRSNGIITSLQAGLHKVKAEYVTRMDSDDIMPPDRLQLMVDRISRSPEKSVVTGLVKYFGDQPISPGYLKYQDWINQRIKLNDHWKWIYRECIVASPNWLMKTNDLRDIGGFDGLSYPEDYDLVFRWYQNGLNIISVDALTLRWREHPARISRNSSHYDQQHFFQLKLNHFVKHQWQDVPLLLWGTAAKGKLTAGYLKKNGIPFRWMARDRGNGSVINDVPIEDFALDRIDRPFKLLISVYPENRELNLMVDYLDQQELQMGTDYWFL